MSLDIQWETITSGPDGQALAENIRAFIHDKFQQIILPRFISSVSVHSFDFGDECPKIEIKDVCDPLPEFYEEDEDDEPEATSRADKSGQLDGTSSLNQDHLHQLQDQIMQTQVRADTSTPSSSILLQHAKFPLPPSRIDTARVPPLHLADQLGSPFLRSGTPGIPGGTSNLSYFHLPLSGLSGTQTPLAVASGTQHSSNGWHAAAPQLSLHGQYAAQETQSPGGDRVAPQSPSRPSTANTLPSPGDLASPFSPRSPEQLPTTYGAAEKVSDNMPYPPLRLEAAQPSDLQVVARVKYAGNVRMALTAEILLDYPMPSFVGIPLKLSVTGVTFDGVAILASIGKRAHFCFLTPEDAYALVGADEPGSAVRHSGANPAAASSQVERRLGGLLQEIRVESEIGRQESGKQVLKNVGKVEKFVLEQVRRIFEEEFVFPSFWTFLV